MAVTALESPDRSRPARTASWVERVECGVRVSTRALVFVVQPAEMRDRAPLALEHKRSDLEREREDGLEHSLCVRGRLDIVLHLVDGVLDVFQRRS